MGSSRTGRRFHHTNYQTIGAWVVDDDIQKHMEGNLQEVKKGGRILYHGTDKDSANKAWKHGLVPGRTAANPSDNHPGYSGEGEDIGVYLTTDPDIAAHFGQRNRLHTDVVVLSIDTSKLDRKKFVKFGPDEFKTILYRGSIPPDAIVDWKEV